MMTGETKIPPLELKPETAPPSDSSSQETSVEDTTTSKQSEDAWFDALDSDGDDYEVEATPPQEATLPATPQEQEAERPEDPKPEPQAQPKTPEPAQQEPPAQEPVPEPQAEPQQAQAAETQTTESTPPASVDDLVQALESNQSDLIDRLSKDAFALTEKDVEALEEDAAAYIPQLLARTHLQSVGAALRYIQALVPQMVAQATTQAAEGEKAVNAFYEKWPQLKDAKYEQEVQKAAATYRQLYPDAPLADVIDNVGGMVMVRHGLVPQQQPQPQAEPAPAPVQAKAEPYAPPGATRSPAPPMNSTQGIWDGFDSFN